MTVSGPCKDSTPQKMAAFLTTETWFTGTLIFLRPPKNFITYYIPVTCYLKCNICRTAQQLKVPSIAYIVNRIVLFNPLTPVNDQDRISLYHINTISSRQVMRIKKLSIRGLLFDFNIKFSKLTSYEFSMTESKENY